MSESPPALRGLTILVVDDDRDCRDSLTELLELEGAEAVGVATSAEALEAHSSFSPDLMIVDLLLGEDDGYELLSRIRARERPRRTPAMALTASRLPWKISGPAGDDFAMTLHKPFEVDELLLAIARLAERRPLTNG